jgi:hypothetical protein
MAGPSGITARRELPFPLLTDTPDAERDIKELAEALDQFAKFNQGIIAARPLAAASKEGDIYWATDDVSYGPTGTWWVLKAGAWVMFPLPTIVAAMIAAEAVTTPAVKALAITEPKLGEESVATIKLKNLAVTAAKIAANTITAAQIAAATIKASNLEAGTLAGAWTAPTGLNAKLTSAEGITGVQALDIRSESGGVSGRIRGGVAAKAGEEYLSGETLFTLPVGLRPPGVCFLPCVLNTAGVITVPKMQVTSAGVCTLNAAIKSNAVLTFDSLTFNLT